MRRSKEELRKLEKEQAKILVSLGIIGVIIIFTFFSVMRPGIIGYVTGEREQQYIDDIGLTFNESAEYGWYPDHAGQLNSVKMSGSVSGQAKVYIQKDGINYLVLDSSDEGVGGITGYVVSDLNINKTIEEINNETQIDESTENNTTEPVSVNETSINETIDKIINDTKPENETIKEPIEKIIDIKLEYNNGTNFDKDNDGIETLDGVVDLTVENSIFNLDIDEEKLCTKWEVYSKESKEATIVCHGSDSCCNFVGVQPYQPNWDDIFYLNYGRYGSTQNNIVSAQVIYFDYDESIPKLETQISESASLSAIFNPTFIAFDNACIETCSLSEFEKNSYKLIIELENGSTLNLDKILYSIRAKNNAPVFNDIANKTIMKNTELVIDLSDYAADPDGDELTFTSYEPSSINVTIDGNIATLTPDINFTGIRFLFFIANDSKTITISNMFKIEVVGPKQLKITPDIKDAKGNSVKAKIKFLEKGTKTIKLQKETGKPGIFEISETSEELEEGIYDIEIELESHPIKKIAMNGVQVNNNLTEFIDIDDAPETDNFIEVYAIDPTLINFTNATVTVSAKGTELYKCKDWNFEGQTCEGEWIKLMDITPGENYTFTLTPDDPGFGESTIEDCIAEDNAASAGLWNSICDNAYPGTALFYDDATYETHTLIKTGNAWAGLRINSTNTSVNDCISITEVYFCYKWWAATTRTQSCDVSVDADGGTSYTAVTTTCPGTTEPGIINCTDITSFESWTCDNFFGSTGALAKSEAQHSGGGPTTPYEITWDVFYFNVTYSTVDLVYPTWSNNKTNASYLTRINEDVYFNVTLTDNLGGSYQRFYFYNGVSLISDSAELWSTPEELNEVRTITAIRNQTIRWYWWFNDSVGNTNQTPRWNFTVANTPPIFTVNPAINNSAPKTNDTINCNAGTYYDVDTDPKAAQYWLWYENNILIPGQTSQTLDLNLAGFTKGDNITCSEKASDGFDNSTWYNSTTIKIQNTPPTITGTIPDQTVNNSNYWSYDANATDPDLDEGIDTLTWYDDTALFDINSTTGYFTDTPIESEAGTYQILINVSDGTDDDTQTFTYSINDIAPPNVTLEYPPDGFYYDLAPTYDVDFNCSATDGYSLRNVSLWITDSSNQSFSQDQSSTITGTSNSVEWTVNLAKGNYTWNCLVYDEFNNSDWGKNRSLSINFSFDLIPPVINWINDTPDPVNRSDNITITANVTDNLGIDSVWIDIENINYTMLPRTYYNGITQAFFDGFETGTFATNNWTTSGTGAAWAPSTIDSYLGTYSAIAENTVTESTLETIIDTTDYVNVTLSFYYGTEGLDGGEYIAADWYNGTTWTNILAVEDAAGWTLSVTNLPSSADDNTDLRVRFRCLSNNNNELCKVDNVQVNGTERLYTDIYEYNYNTTPLDNGTYNYTVHTKDDYDNDAVPYTGNFAVIWNDYNAPSVFRLIPEAGTNQTATYSIEIGANITDDGFIHTVLANITFPDGTLQQLTLSNVIGDKYNTSFTIPPIYGRYNVTFIVNDTANNVNNSETTYFNGVYVDVTPPTSDSPLDQEVDIGQESSITWNIDDDISSGYYYVERNSQLYKGPAAWLNETPVIIAANNYFPSVWNYTIFFNDSTGNDGIQDTVLVTVVDTTIPSCEDAEGDTPVLVNITIDGSMDDWDGVRINDKNFVSDPTEGAGDLDTGMTADRDLVEFAFTWNPETLYFYFRRLNSGTNVITMLVYLDYDNDGYMNATDQVLVFNWWGSNQKYNAELYDYTPAGTADYMNGSGHDLPGSISPSATIESQIVGGAETGIELETRVDWSDLGLSEPTAINYQVASSLGTNVPSQIQDNGDTINSIYGLLLFQPDHTSSTKNGTSLYYDHDLMNCGVLEELIELTNQSSEGFPLILYYPNGSLITDSNGDGNPDVYLRPNNYTTVIAKIDVPGPTPLYTIDITTITATSSVDTAISETVTDTTTISVISITPYQRETSATPGTTLTLNYTVSNYQEISDTLEISSASDQGWTTALYHPNGSIITDTDGDTNPDLGVFSPSESKKVLLKIFIPSNESYGTNDTTTIYINSSANPSIISSAQAKTGVRKRLVVDTDYDRSVGIGESTYYPLTITNNWNESDVIDITYTYFFNWTTQFFDSDKVTPLTDTDSDGIIDIDYLGPFGEQKVIYVKVTIPSEANEYDSEITTVYVNSSLAPSEYDSVVINTTARTLITYGTAARITEQTVFEAGKTVYGRAHNLIAINNVYFVWIDSNNTIFRTSSDIPVSAETNADDTLPTNTSILLGTWVVVVFDAQGDTELGRAYFNLMDLTPPNVTLISPIAGSLYNISDVVEIAANVTDNIAVDTVLANITYPNGSSIELSLNKDIYDKYNTSFTIPEVPGQYNVRFIANDTSGNINDSETTYFIVGEYEPPSVFNLTPVKNSTFNVSDQIEIGANVTDNVAVATVVADVAFPNGTVQTITLSRVGLTDRYNITYIVPSLAGRYNITIIANDTSGNVNGSETTYFYAQDNFYPSVFDLIPVAGSKYSGGEGIEIGANVTDNGLVDTVIANITFPNSTTEQLILSQAIGDKFNNSFIVPNLKGRYNITFIANDTNNNVNDTEKTYFVTINVLPTHERPILVSSSGQNVSTDDLIVYPQNVSDLDGDNVTTIPDWRLNKSSIAVLNMPFDSNTSSNYTNTVRDYSTYGNNGLLGEGNITQKPAWTAGRIGGAYNFDGQDDYIDIGSAADFTSTQSFAIEAWVNKEANTTARVVSKKTSNAAIDPGYQLAITASNAVEARIADGTNIIIKNSTTSINLGTWYHIAMVVDRSAQTLQVYINGQAQGSAANITPTNINPSTTSPLRIGSSSHTTPIEFFNGTIDQVKIYNRALSSDQLRKNFLAGNNSNNSLTLGSNETNQGDVWTAAITPNDGFGDGITKISNNLTIQVNQAPTAPVLIYPQNNASIVDRTPTFIWNNSYDPDADPLFYRLIVDDDSLFSSPEIDTVNIPETPTQTNYTPVIELDVDKIYYWRVRATDNKTYGGWSTVFNFTLESYAAISLIVDTVNFSTVLPSYTDDTNDNNPPPFLLENQGNIHVNITVTGTKMFESGDFPGDNLQFKIDANETSSFDYGLSTTGWNNITNVSSMADIVNFDWHDISDTAEADIRIKVPDEEPPGDRNSTITFSVI